MVEKQMRMVTVISGHYKNAYGCVMVEFTDGDCIVDLGNDMLVYEHVNNLSFWQNVKGLEFKNGKLINCEI